MPFLLTYTVVNYAYFALAMSCELKQKQEIEDASNEESPGASYLKDLYGKVSKKDRDPEKAPLIDDSRTYGSQEKDDETKVKAARNDVWHHVTNVAPPFDLKGPNLLFTAVQHNYKN